MYYREAGQFKTTYAADSRIFPILQDRAGMLLLCAIAFMPFATAYMSENYGQRVPAVLYNGVLLTTALLNLRLIRRVTSAPYVATEADPFEVAVHRARPWRGR